MPTGIWLHFEWHRADLVAEHCVQRDAEVNTCQGRCYLQEKLGLTEEKETVPDFRLPEMPEWHFLANPDVPFQGIIRQSRKGLLFPPYRFCFESLYPACAEKPPRWVTDVA
jgi:hypothetical protein